MIVQEIDVCGQRCMGRLTCAAKCMAKRGYSQGPQHQLLDCEIAHERRDCFHRAPGFTTLVRDSCNPGCFLCGGEGRSRLEQLLVVRKEAEVPRHLQGSSPRLRASAFLKKPEP